MAGVAISPLNTQTSPATIADVMDAGHEGRHLQQRPDAFPGAVASYSADNYSFCHQTGEAAVKFIQENYGADETINIGVIQFKTQIPEQSADRVDGFFAALTRLASTMRSSPTRTPGSRIWPLRPPAT